MDHGLSTQDLAGMFAFRFSGFAMRNGILYHLAGVGQFEIDAEGKIIGGHRSSLTALQGQNAKLEAGRYELQGEISLNDGIAGYAKIHFIDRTRRGFDLDGEFYVVATGVDRLWLVSSRDLVPPEERSGPWVPADELVSLEAVRIVTPSETLDG